MRNELNERNMIYLATGIGVPFFTGFLFLLFFVFDVYATDSYEPIILLTGIIISLVLGVHVFKIVTSKEYTYNRCLMFLFTANVPLIVAILIVTLFY